MMKKMFLKKVVALGTLAAISIVPAACLATSVESGNVKAKTGIDALNKPLEKLGGAMTGAVPKIGVTVAAAGGALSWAMGTEQQIVKYATRAAMGGGVAMAAPSVVSDLTNDSDASGCEF